MHDIISPKHRAAKAVVLEKKVGRRSTGVKKRKTTLKPEVLAEAKKEFLERKEGRFPLKEIVAGAVVLALLLGAYGFLKLPKATVQMWPVMETVTLQEKVLASTSKQEPGALESTIPAHYLEVLKDASQEFPATGITTQDGKATGNITIYNKINPSTPFTLIKGTHFLSDSGKYFITLQKVTIPAATNKTPGSITVQVQAETAGAEANIGPSKFSIPKLNGTSYYHSLYASSNADMKGGYTGKLKKVTDDDLETAKDVLVEKLLQEAKDELRNNLDPNDVLLDDAVTSSVVASSANAKSGAIYDTFQQSAKVKVTALVFKKIDVEQFVVALAKAHLSDDSRLFEKSVTINYRPSTFDVQKKIITLNLDSSFKKYYYIDTLELINLFSTKSSDQIKQIVDQKYNGNIFELKVNFWPFWVRRAPSDQDRIKVDLILE